MRREDRTRIRDAILHDMAPACAGQISLEDVARVFRGRGDLKEIEDCLDDFVKEGLAKKSEFSGRSYYLFESIARDTVDQNQRVLANVGKELEAFQKEKDGLERLFEEEKFALNRLRPLWLTGWEKSGLEKEEFARIQMHIALFLDKRGQDLRREIGRVEDRIRELEVEKKQRLRNKEESFITLPASG